MINTPKNWKLTSYTNDTWTALVDEEAVVAAIVLANTDAVNPITVALRVGTTIMVPDTEIAAGATETLDVRSLVVMDAEDLELRADAAGIHAIASGGISV